jgi:hypothetical protein
MRQISVEGPERVIGAKKGFSSASNSACVIPALVIVNNFIRRD